MDVRDPDTFWGQVVIGIVIGIVSGPIVGVFHVLAYWLFH
jgi:hypothetical protein